MGYSINCQVTNKLELSVIYLNLDQYFLKPIFVIANPT